MRYFSEKNVGCEAIFDVIAIPAFKFGLQLVCVATANFVASQGATCIEGL